MGEPRSCRSTPCWSGSVSLGRTWACESNSTVFTPQLIHLHLVEHGLDLITAIHRVGQPRPAEIDRGVRLLVGLHAKANTLPPRGAAGSLRVFHEPVALEHDLLAAVLVVV